MGFSDQVKKITDNWLIIILIIGVFLFMNAGSMFTTMSSKSSLGGYAQESDFGRGVGSSYAPSYNPDFAPEVKDRMITKSSNLGIETERGKFISTEAQMKSSVNLANGFILSENVYTNNPDNDASHAYKTGNYQVKVDSTKYESVLAQLKQIGNVKTFSENSADITGTYSNIETELAAEKSRLDNYKSMMSTQNYVLADKLTLTDKIFDQERRVKYLEDSKNNVNQQVDYSTISITLNEKPSEFLNLVWVKWTDLVRNFVNSINALISTISWLLPWAIAGGIIWLIVSMFRKKFG